MNITAPVMHRIALVLALALATPMSVFAAAAAPYLIVSDSGDPNNPKGEQSKVVLVQDIHVWDPDASVWKTEHGLIKQDLFNGTAYVDGVANQSLNPAQVYYAFAFVPHGLGYLGLDGVKLDFINKWFLSGDPSGAYSMSAEGPYAVDSQGNTGALVGLLSTYRGNNVWSEASRQQAINEGFPGNLALTPGVYTSSSPYSQMPQQPLAVYSDDGSPIASTIAPPGGEIPALRTIITAWSQQSVNTYFLNGYVWFDTAGATANISIAETPLWGSGQAHYLATQTVTASAANQYIPVYLTGELPATDGAYLYSVSASVAGGTMHYNFEPIVQMME